jgi:hypothetical protein
MKTLAISFMLLICSCKKDRLPVICLDGKIGWEGDPAADGLGWTVRKDSDQLFALKNLSDSFKQPGRLVSICVKKTAERVPCECRDIYYYHIESIQ